MPVLSEEEKVEIQKAGEQAYKDFLDNEEHKPKQKTGRYALLGSWLPILGTAGGTVIGVRKDRESARSFKDKAEAARCMAEYFAAEKIGANPEELFGYKKAFDEANRKAETSNKKYATPWGTLKGGLTISPEDRQAIEQAGKSAKTEDLETSKKPSLSSKSLPYALLGTLVLPLIGTVIGAIIGKTYDSSSTIRRKQHAELKACQARVEKAKELGYEDTEIADFVKEKERTESLYDERYQRTNATSWGTLIGTVFLWLPGAIIGAWTGKYIDKEHNIESKDRADRRAERATDKSRLIAGIDKEEQKEFEGRSDPHVLDVSSSVAHHNTGGRTGESVQEQGRSA